MMNVDILDPEKDYLIIVPLNQIGEDELYRNEIFKDAYISNNLQYMVFHEDQYNYMEPRLFDIINIELGTMINMYEEEIVENDQLEALIDIVDLLISNSDDERFLQFANDFKSLLNVAKKHHTIVGFCF